MSSDTVGYPRLSEVRSDTVGHGSDTNSDSRRIAERHPRTRLGHASRNVDDDTPDVLIVATTNLTRGGDAESIKVIVHGALRAVVCTRTTSWLMQDFVRACTTYKNEPSLFVEDVISCLDVMAGLDVGDSATTRRSFEDSSSA
ncbi:hypothetical protein PPROV_001112500 [Pycnococcus provasolii]|uniref:Uncharacterized protein n=1 Tax=Pycnococcus provasolii TaxID=41880 RepID=A0A830HY59_9CHLO|nr:hypothetical protein PPROV_001112500 [Pycnococcus provasolii]